MAPLMLLVCFTTRRVPFNLQLHSRLLHVGFFCWGVNSSCFQSWVERAASGALLGDVLDLAELLHPDTFLNALRQETAR